MKLTKDIIFPLIAFCLFIQAVVTPVEASNIPISTRRIPAFAG